MGKEEAVHTKGAGGSHQHLTACLQGDTTRPVIFGVSHCLAEVGNTMPPPQTHKGTDQTCCGIEDLCTSLEWLLTHNWWKQ